MKKYFTPFNIFATIMVTITITFIAIVGCSSDNKTGKTSKVDRLASIAKVQQERDSLDRVEKEKQYTADMNEVNILEHKIDSLKTKYCKVTTDKYSGRTFIESKNHPKYINSKNYVGVYLSMDSNNYDSDATLFLYIDYVGSDWIFWDTAYLLFDDENSTNIGIKSYDKTTDVYYGGVCEVGEMSLGSLGFMNSSYDHNRLDIARSILDAKTISVKLTGDFYKIMPCKMNDFKPICEIYFMMNKIRLIKDKYKETDF
jgi:hypothetical protein